MKMMSKVVVLLAAMAAVSAVSANPIAGNTCGSPDRTATLVDAAQCAYGSANPDAADIASYYGNVWESAGELTGNGANGFLTATSDIGWGVIPNSGTWSIDASFWDQYDYAVISMHIGQGNGEPDHWAWLLNSGADSGTWALDYTYDEGTSTKGGGLSNIKLWGVVATDREVPAPSALALLGLGVAGLLAARRRKAKA